MIGQLVSGKQTAWQVKNHQMSIKVAQKWFPKPIERFWQLYKNCLNWEQFGQNNWYHKLWKVAQNAINRPIWSHCLTWEQAFPGGWVALPSNLIENTVPIVMTVKVKSLVQAYVRITEDCSNAEKGIFLWLLSRNATHYCSRFAAFCYQPKCKYPKWA